MTAYEPARDDARLLVVEAHRARLHDRAVTDLPDLLLPGDLLVANDAATLPASLPGRTAAGDPVELRLAGRPRGGRWPAVLLGAGDWRTPTEHRPAPPPLAAGDAVLFGAPATGAPPLTATIAALSPISPRLVEVTFDRGGADLWRHLYQLGRPVQYAHRDRDLALWSVQTAYAGQPWAVEMPSAGRPLSWRVIARLRRRGVELATLTHAAGLSATGDPAIDAALPLPEAYDIPEATAAAVAAARGDGRRVIAIGTTVVRALEGAARAGGVRAGTGWTDVVIDSGAELRAVDGLLTGIHAPGESHYRLLGAFAPAGVLAAASRHAGERGYRPHELGDACLLVPSLEPAPLRRSAAAPGDSPPDLARPATAFAATGGRAPIA